MSTDLPCTEAHRSEFCRLQRAIQAGQGFRLLFGQFNNPQYRDEMIRRLADVIARQVTVDDAAYPSYEVLQTYLIALAATQPTVVHVLGLETWLEHEQSSWLNAFNYQREKLARECPVTILLWLPEALINNFALKAPDIWAWRAGVLDFSMAEAEEQGTRQADRRITKAFSETDHSTDADSSPTVNKIRLLNRLKSLLPAQFEEVFFVYGAPPEYFSSNSSRTENAIELLRYAEMRRDLPRLQQTLNLLSNSKPPETRPYDEQSHIRYPHQRIAELEKNIRKPSTESKDQLFISYSTQDTEWAERIKIHLHALESTGRLRTWDRSKIAPGSIWKEELHTALDQAKAALLLVSADFLASDYISNTEMPILFDKVRESELRIIPVLLRPCQFAYSDLARLQFFNQKAFSTMKPSLVDEALVKLTQHIYKLFSD